MAAQQAQAAPPDFISDADMQAAQGQPSAAAPPDFISDADMQKAQASQPSAGGSGWDAYGSAMASAPSNTKAIVNNLPQIGGLVGGVLGTPFDAISGPLGNIAGAGIGGAAGSAIKNVANKWLDPQNTTSGMDSITQPIVEGAKQAAWQAGAEVLNPVVGKALSWGGKKVLSSLGGVNPAVIDEYLQNADRINSSQTVDQLKEVSDKFVGNLSSDLENKKLTLDQAQDAFSALGSDLKDKYRSAGYDARDAVSAATQALQDSHQNAIQSTAQDIVDTIGQLRKQVVQGSSESFDILGQSGQSIPVAPIKGKVTNLINDLKIAGKTPIGDDATAAANQLQTIRDALNQFPKQLPASEAKKMVQQLQQSTTYGQGPGTFSQSGDKALKDISSYLGDTLKSNIPAYADKMLGVSADTGLLKNVSDFQDPGAAAGLLSRINNPTQIERKDAITQLGNKFGKNFLQATDKSSLPEAGLLQKAQNNLDAFRPDKVSSAISDTLSNSPEAANLQQAQQGVNQAQDALDPFKSLAPNVAGQTQAQQKLLQLAKGKNIELDKMFDQLGKMTDTDFVQSMHDQNVLAAFQKGATNGSRNVFFGSVLGFLLHGPMGAAAGAGAGRVADQYGPALTKQVLDGAMSLSKNPTMSKLMSLSLPPDVKDRMKVGFENWMMQKMAPSPKQPQYGLMAPSAAPTAPPPNFSTIPGRNGQ